MKITSFTSLDFKQLVKGWEVTTVESLSQEEKELIIVALANTIDDTEQVDIHTDAQALYDKLIEKWQVPHYRSCVIL